MRLQSLLTTNNNAHDGYRHPLYILLLGPQKAGPRIFLFSGARMFIYCWMAPPFTDTALSISWWVVILAFFLTGCDYTEIPEETIKLIQKEAKISDEAIDDIRDILERDKARATAVEETQKYLDQAQAAKEKLRQKLEEEKDASAASVLAETEESKAEQVDTKIEEEVKTEEDTK